MKGESRVLAAPAFERATLRIPIDDITPLREMRASMRKLVKYGQIAASVREVGIIEPPVVVRDPQTPERFLLLDGHLRIDVLKADGAKEVVCLIATDDEAFTYNRRVNRIAIIEEHKMVLEAIKRGLSEERLARALGINISSIRKRRTLLSGICPEVVELLRDHHVPFNAFTQLRRLKPMRQIRAAEMMVAMNRFATGYVESIVAATPPDQLVNSKRPLARGLTAEQVDLMSEESARLDREFKLIEQSYGADHLDLMLASTYIANLLNNARVVRHLAQFHREVLQEFQKIAELQKAA